MREKDIFPSEDGEDKEKSTWNHEEHQHAKDDGEEERKEGMDILQPHHRDIPEQKDEREEDQTGKNQKTDKNSLLGFSLQKPLPYNSMSNVKIQSSNQRKSIPNIKT